ncbi:hypothetical protein JTB14_008331 [Gonioctena quinquepunctata]|nr:hypothetical protein JTB14_008331 [Gonioctena quinquepunctata]
MNMGPTVHPFGNFHDDVDAQDIYDALDGVGTNERAIIDILTKRTNEQRRMIPKTYKTMFGQDMIEDIKSDLGGDFEDVILALMREPIEFQAKELHHAISGLGTDERTILEILAVHDNEEVIQISEKYQERRFNNLFLALRHAKEGPRMVLPDQNLHLAFLQVLPNKH